MALGRKNPFCTGVHTFLLRSQGNPTVQYTQVSGICHREKKGEKEKKEKKRLFESKAMK